MKLRIFTFLCAAILLGQIAAAQPAGDKPTANEPIAGVWRAQMNGLPAFTLVVTDENGGLSGAILFYLQKREDANHPYTATPGLPEPIFNPRFDGKTLTFQVSHRRAHPPRTLNDSPVTFALTLTQDGKAQFVNQSEGGPITVTRSDY
ncbi:MAG TPA: hypothetical protein VME23_17855 [Terracidiphilus sp.]|nr:hypothetical protein [Terracidiphilus sp.]